MSLKSQNPSEFVDPDLSARQRSDWIYRLAQTSIDQAIFDVLNAQTPDDLELAISNLFAAEQQELTANADSNFRFAQENQPPAQDVSSKIDQRIPQIIEKIRELKQRIESGEASIEDVVKINKVLDIVRQRNPEIREPYALPPVAKIQELKQRIDTSPNQEDIDKYNRIIDIWNQYNPQDQKEYKQMPEATPQTLLTESLEDVSPQGSSAQILEVPGLGQPPVPNLLSFVQNTTNRTNQLITGLQDFINNLSGPNFAHLGPILGEGDFNQLKAELNQAVAGLRNESNNFLAQLNDMVAGHQSRAASPDEDGMIQLAQVPTKWRERLDPRRWDVFRGDKSRTGTIDKLIKFISLHKGNIDSIVNDLNNQAAQLSRAVNIPNFNQAINNFTQRLTNFGGVLDRVQGGLNAALLGVGGPALQESQFAQPGAWGLQPQTTQQPSYEDYGLGQIDSTQQPTQSSPVSPTSLDDAVKNLGQLIPAEYNKIFQEFVTKLNKAREGA